MSHWCGNFQKYIILSTTEAEYIILHIATRELLPLRDIIVVLN